MKSFENKVVVVTDGHKMQFVLFVLALFLCVNASFAEETAAQDSLSENESMVDGRKVKRFVFQSSQEAFLDFDRSFKWSTPLLDEERVKNAPVETVLDFYWCWSNGDSSPFCKVEFLDSEGKPVVVTEIKGERENVCRGGSTSDCLSASVNPTGVSKDKWIPLKKADLKSQLGAEIHQIKSVHMYQDEKTDPAWGLFAGLYAAEVVAVVSMLVEIPISYALDKPYNWKHVGIATLVGFVGVSAGSMIYIAANPAARRVDVTIKF